MAIPQGMSCYHNGYVVQSSVQESLYCTFHVTHRSLWQLISTDLHTMCLISNMPQCTRTKSIHHLHLPVQVAIRLTAPTIFLYALSLPSCAGSDWLLVFRLVYLAWLSSLLSSLFVAAVAAAVSCHSNILRDKQWKTCWHTVYIKLVSSYQLNSL